MTNFKFKSSLILAFIYVLSMAISSCSTSESVVGNGFLQKRKYNKGFHKTKKSKVKPNKNNNKEVLVLNSAENSDIEKLHKTENVVKVSKTNNTYDKQLDEEKNTVEEQLVLVKNTTKENSIESESKTKKTSKLIHAVENKFNNAKTVLKEKTSLSIPSNTSSTLADTMFILLIILAFLIPPLAVGIHTNVDWLKVLIALLLMFSFFAVKILVSLAVIYALLVIFDIL